MTGSRCAATNQATRRPAGACDEDTQTPFVRRARVLAHGFGVAMRRSHLELARDPALLELAERRLHALAVGLRADEDADEGERARHRCRDDTKALGRRWLHRRVRESAGGDVRADRDGEYAATARVRA